MFLEWFDTDASNDFDETFGVHSAFNADIFVAPPHAIAMEFDLFGERRRDHWGKGCKLQI